MKHRDRILAGFTLVEIMIVVSIIGLLAVIAIPSFLKARTNSQMTSFLNDLRVFSDGAEMFIMERGSYPADSEPAELVAGWDSYVNVVLWTNSTPIGGDWDTERDWGITFALGVMGPSFTAVQMAELDTKIDDGDLTSGQFRELAPSRYYMVLQE